MTATRTVGVSVPRWILSVSTTTGGEVLLDVVQVQHPDAHMNVAIAFYGHEFNNGQVREPVLGVRVDLT